MDKVRTDNQSSSRSSQTDFTRVLRSLYFRRRLAYGKVAAAAHLDVKYMYELVQGTKHNPSRDIVIRIGTALHVGVNEMDELLLAANHAPLVRPKRMRYRDDEAPFDEEPLEI